MSDPRIAIVRSWLGEDNPWENVDRLLTRIDDASSQPPEMVERVAKAIQSTRAQQFGAEEPWASIPESEQDEFRELARIAIQEIPAPMSSADREVVEAAEAWLRGGDFTMANGYDRALVGAVEELIKSKRAASREGKR